MKLDIRQHPRKPENALTQRHPGGLTLNGLPMNKIWRNWFVTGSLATMLWTGSGWPAYADPAPPREYEVKATFLFNFAQFIEWPASVFTNATAPFVIGVLGDDPFGHVLNQTVQGETIQDRRIVLKHAKRIEDLAGCQILFISRSEHARIAQVLGTVGHAGVLTVSETDQFLRQGGIINFITTHDNQVRFEINLPAADRAGLKINAKLLKVAQTVAPPTHTENR